MRRALLAAMISVLAGAQAVGQTPSVPNMINYQGRLTDRDGLPFSTGTYTLNKLEIGIYRSGTRIWGPQIFDGGSGTGHGSTVTVVNGYFNVLLGPLDTASRSLASAFNGDTCYVSVKVNNDAELTPRQRLYSAPYAFHAWDATTLGNGLVAVESGNVHVAGSLEASGTIESTSGGFKFSDGSMLTCAPRHLGGNVVVVAKSGGDFSNVQTAINSIADASSTNPYTVWIAPGVYPGSWITTTDYVSLVGAGREETILSLTRAVKLMGSFMSIEGLTINSTYNEAIECHGDVWDVHIRDAIIKGPQWAFYTDAYESDAQFELERVKITGPSAGIYASNFDNLDVTFRNCEIISNYAFRTWNSDSVVLRAYDSRIGSGYYWIYGDDYSEAVIHCAGCQLAGSGFIGTLFNLSYVHCYDANWDPKPDY